MRPDSKNIDDIVKRFLPSAAKQDMERDIARVLYNLKFEDSHAFDLALKEHWINSRRIPYVNRWAWIMVAASVLLVISLGTMVWHQSPTAGVLESANNSKKIEYGAIIWATGNAGEQLRLEDGSRVEMQSGSELSVERADDGIKIRLSKGGVIVIAAKQHGHLYVQTKDVTVSVVGTMFLVNTGEDGSRVAVIEGEVHVQQGKTATKLLPGDQIASNPLMPLIPLDDEVSWSRTAVEHIALLQLSTASQNTSAIPTLGIPPPVQHENGAAVSGIVLKSQSGEVVPAVDVSISIATSGKVLSAATSDNTGHFFMQDIPAGQYRISAVRNGYLKTQYGQRGPLGPGLPIALKDGEKRENIELRMYQASVISGRVTEETGEPADGAEVSVFRWDMVNNWRTLAVVQTGKTNDLGDYRISGLSPGRYYVGVKAASASLYDTDPSKNTAISLSFFPGTPYVQSASAVVLNAGDSAAGTNIRMATMQKVGRVRGVVRDGSTGNILSGATVNLVARQPYRTVSVPQATTSATGGFETRGSSGSYFLSVLAKDSSGKILTAMIPIENSDGDTLNVNVIAYPRAGLLGRLSIEGLVQTDKPWLSKVIVRADPVPPVLGSIARASIAAADGTFTIGSLDMGADFRISLDNLPQNYYLKSIRLATRDIPDDIVHTSAENNERVEVILGTDAGNISGTVNTANSKLASGSTVVLIPNKPWRERSNLYRSSVVDESGHFQFQSITPGSYTLFAWEDVGSGAWFDPVFLDSFEDRGTSIIVMEGASLNVTLKTLSNKTP